MAIRVLHPVLRKLTRPRTLSFGRLQSKDTIAITKESGYRNLTDLVSGDPQPVTCGATNRLLSLSRLPQKRCLLLCVVAASLLVLTYLLESLRDPAEPSFPKPLRILRYTPCLGLIGLSTASSKTPRLDTVRLITVRFGVPPTLVAERSLALRLHLRNVVTILLDSLLERRFDGELRRFQPLPERRTYSGW